jgi:hypothetical protein
MPIFISTDEKDLKARIKIIYYRLSERLKVILSKADAAPLPQGMVNRIREEFLKFNIRAISDSSLIPALSKSEEDSKDKASIIVNNLRNYSARFGKGIMVVTLSYEDFTKTLQ